MVGVTGDGGGVVVPFPVIAAPLRTRPAHGPEAPTPVDGPPTARGPARRDRSPEAALGAVAAARSAAEVAAAQFLRGLGPGLAGTVPPVHG